MKTKKWNGEPLLNKCFKESKSNIAYAVDIEDVSSAIEYLKNKIHIQDEWQLEDLEELINESFPDAIV